jgi:hypothetical protein
VTLLPRLHWPRWTRVTETLGWSCLRRSWSDACRPHAYSTSWEKSRAQLQNELGHLHAHRFSTDFTQSQGHKSSSRTSNHQSVADSSHTPRQRTHPLRPGHYPFVQDISLCLVRTSRVSVYRSCRCVWQARRGSLGGLLAGPRFEAQSYSRWGTSSSS